MKNKITVASIILMVFLCADTCHAADYPGNANFRNVGVTFAAQNRTDWVTNVTTMVGSARNPGTSTPIDWSCAQSITNGIDYIPAVLTTAGGWPRTLICHFVRIDLATPNLRFTGTGWCCISITGSGRSLRMMRRSSNAWPRGSVCRSIRRGSRWRGGRVNRLRWQRGGSDSSSLPRP